MSDMSVVRLIFHRDSAIHNTFIYLVITIERLMGEVKVRKLGEIEMYEILEKGQEEQILEIFKEKKVSRVERPCRGCENLAGVSILYRVGVDGRVPVNYHYNCKDGLVLSSTTKKDGGCPIKSFKPREDGEVELTPESLRKHGFKKWSLMDNFVKKLNPNHPQAKRYGEIVIHPGEDLLRFLSQIYDIWLREK